MTVVRVRAAGGVVIRDEPRREVLVVHRPRYDDWSLPKGKLETGESEADAAVREVYEETGYRGRVLHEVGRVRYVDSRGRDKEVAYFAMRAEEPSTFEPGSEVDQVRWIPVEDAASFLTHDRDAQVVARAVS